MTKRVSPTPEAILSFPALLVPKAPPPNSDGTQGEPKYGASFIFLPGADMTAIEAAAMEAFTEKWPGPANLAKLKAGGFKWAIRKDAEAKGYPEGSVFINARSLEKPGLVFPWKTSADDPKPAVVADDQIKTFFYPGAIVRASITAFVYDLPMSKGVSFGLNNVQWLRHGTRIDGRKAAQEDFEPTLASAPADLSDTGAE